ncbi:3-dehydroquinate synthase [Solicola gregarius]|uniref:3-dehydroquinate synthase n=1 Tax=Solicola gregarius TaxID=2908642 RepID=A0AA46TGR3_9ACTN|nr:3-dehydroquinate synthase [Solicola gregarius]UYM04836.1 3-dehydroquinate synthase [Solicola gregarius]
MTASQPERLRVDSERPYDVAIGDGALDDLPDLIGADAQRVAIIHPTTLASPAESIRKRLMNDTREAHCIEVPEGETAKTSEVAAFCWRVLGQAGFTRSDVVIGLGGGSTTDLAGFVAATWLRGVGYVTVPTSLLGMVDAAVGGKTGINTDEGKNLVGAFYEPRGVLCDTTVLATLPDNELRSGLAEVIKCGFIADPQILDLVEDDPAAALDASGPVLAELIERAVRVKADVVAADLREDSADGVGREMLNYGHTLGHAVERVEQFTFRHGAAVAIGMCFAAQLAGLSGRIDRALVDRHRNLLQVVGLPTAYRPGVWPELYDAMRLDKKTRGDRLRFVVLDALAEPAILSGPDPALLTAAYAEISR